MGHSFSDKGLAEADAAVEASWSRHRRPFTAGQEMRIRAPGLTLAHLDLQQVS
jgi:hypothetical protein